MRKIIACTIIIFACPAVAVAACDMDGATIVFVNGVFTDSSKAKVNRLELEKATERITPNVKVVNGFNPPHLAGLADAIQVISQAWGTPLSNYDRDTILRQVHGELVTRKVLLLGHSQGTFYTNEIYEYLVKNGVSKESIAVYNVATQEAEHISHPQTIISSQM